MTTSFYPNRNSSRKCAFCHEEGHHVRDCTVLANNECGYCHNLGHTTRRCPVLAERDTNRRRRANAQRYKSNGDGFSQPKKTFRRRVSRVAPVLSATTRLTSFTTFAAAVETSPKKKVSHIAVPAPSNKVHIRGSWKKPLNIDYEREPPRKLRTIASTTAIASNTAIASPTAIASTTASFKPKNKSYIGMWADMADAASDEETDDEDISCDECGMTLNSDSDYTDGEETVMCRRCKHENEPSIFLC